MKTQCPVCDTIQHLSEGQGPTKVKCPGCHATYTAEMADTPDAGAAWPSNASRNRPWASKRSASDAPLFGDPERAHALGDWHEADEDFLTGNSARAFDPERAIQIPESRPLRQRSDRSAKRRSRLEDQDALLQAAMDIPSGGGGAAQVGVPESRRSPDPLRTPESEHAREHRPMGAGAKALVLAVLLGALAAGAWITMGDALFTEAEGFVDALGIAIEEASDDAVATAQRAPEAAPAPVPVPSTPRQQGQYVEHIEERGGRTVRVWAPKDSKPMAGTGKPQNAPRARAPKPRKAAPSAPTPKAPRFIMKSADGGKVDLEKLRGKVVVLNFFATWCQPCKREIPDFVRFHKETASKGKVKVYGVLMESGELGKAAATSKRMGVTYPMLAGNLVVKHNYRVEGYPTTVVIGPKGRIRATAVGMIKYERLQKMVAKALK